MAEPFFRMMEILVPSIVAANGNKITFEGLENIPERGGALIALNHTSYVDWVPASIAAHHRRRRLRFMIKAEMQDVRAVNGRVGNELAVCAARSGGRGRGNGALSRLDLTEQLPAVSAFGVEIRRRAAVQRAYELGMKRGQLVAHGLKFLAVPAEQLRDSDRHVVGGRGRQPGRGARRRSGRFPKRRADGRQIPRRSRHGLRHCDHERHVVPLDWPAATR